MRIPTKKITSGSSLALMEPRQYRLQDQQGSLTSGPCSVLILVMGLPSLCSKWYNAHAKQISDVLNNILVNHADLDSRTGIFSITLFANPCFTFKKSSQPDDLKGIAQFGGRFV